MRVSYKEINMIDHIIIQLCVLVLALLCVDHFDIHGFGIESFIAIVQSLVLVIVDAIRRK